jgi:outer membrane protein OmpA-like peptidoglycan-associated protein
MLPLRRKFVLAAVAALALSGPAIQGQSHDAHSPTPLGPGVNKGNVDNKTGPNYYSFYAGPGHVDLKFGFKELGVFGNPLRQNLSFDLYTEDGKIISHDVVTSLDKLEQLSTSGDFGSRHKVTLRVIAPDTALRLGGYYEIEVTGAVSFGGAAATGANAKPENTELYKSGTSLYTPGTSLYTPGKALTVQETHDEVRISLAADILFDFDKAAIRPAAVAALHQAAALIRDKGRGVVRIQGYTDSKGENGHNLRLSNERASAVKAWLMANEKSNGAMLQTQGLGAADPVAPNAKPDGSDNPEGRQRNRRVELIVSK